MLQIRLNNPTSEGGGGGGEKALPVDSVMVACPDHLVLADLAVAKSLGSATAASFVKTVGRRSRRQLGERVHFCVRCDFPIAIYGRLSPCEHAFCLDCARSDSICYLCDERIQKIQTIKLMEGIFICAAPHCLKSFLKKSEFESHIHGTHADLLQPNREKEDGNESEGVSAKQSTALESTGRAPSSPVFSPNSSSQVNDREEKASRSQPRDQPPPRSIVMPKPPQSVFGQILGHPTEHQMENNRPHGFDRTGSYNSFPQQNIGTLGGLQQESGQLSDKQQGMLSEIPFSDHPPMNAHPPPNFAVPINSNPVLAPPPFGYSPFPPEGGRPFYSSSYEMARPDSAPEVGSEQGSLLGFPPGSAGGVNFSDSYPRPWMMGPAGVPLQPYMSGQGSEDGSANMSDSQGRVAFSHNAYGRDPGVLTSNMPNKGMEAAQDVPMEPRDSSNSRRLLAPQALPHPPLPPPPPPHLSQLNRGGSREGQNFGWQNDKRDSFGSGQDL